MKSPLFEDFTDLHRSAFHLSTTVIPTRMPSSSNPASRVSRKDAEWHRPNVRQFSDPLSFWRQPVVIKLATVTKRLTTSLLLCLLTFAILSGRLVLLQQAAMAADSNTNVQQPVDYFTPSGFGGRFLVPEALQDAFDLQKLAPPSVLAAGDLFRDAGQLLRLEINTCTKPPAYILQSVLNL